jgi:serine/threonine protein kinase
MGQEIGTGTFGKVLRGKCRGKDVAIKVLHKPIDDEKTLTSFKKEVEIMRYAVKWITVRYVRSGGNVARGFFAVVPSRFAGLDGPFERRTDPCVMRIVL